MVKLSPILEKVGEGGMGVVPQARDTHLVRAAVADASHKAASRQPFLAAAAASGSLWSSGPLLDEDGNRVGEFSVDRQ